MATKSDHRHLHSADMMRPFPKQSYASSNSDRPLSDLINLPPLSSKQRAVRPISDIVQAAHIYRNSISSEGSLSNYTCCSAVTTFSVAESQRFLYSPTRKLSC